ncbi:MAG: UDP-3-O-(3-hydroxymyristoyl)glucosamine N-acyltransferase [Desulfatibacillaceae bacterium]
MPTDLSSENKRPAPMTLERIAGLVGGKAEIRPDMRITGVRPFDEAGPGELTCAMNASYLTRLDETSAGAVIVPPGADAGDKPVIRSDNPYLAFSRAIACFHPLPRPWSGISPKAHVEEDLVCGDDPGIAPGVVVGRDVRIGHRAQLHPGVVLGHGVVLGDDVTLHPNVTVAERCTIGNRVTVHAGTVIGSDGFGWAPDGMRYNKIHHVGIVQVDDDVEIGANCALDRGTFGRTWLQRGVKTDNLVHVAHNVTVGEDTLLVAQAGVSGSVTIGRHVILAGQVGVANNVEIGDNTVVVAQSGVSRSIPGGEVVTGTPAMPHRQWLRVQSVLGRLPELRRTLLALEKRVKRLEHKDGG